MGNNSSCELLGATILEEFVEKNPLKAIPNNILHESLSLFEKGIKEEDPFAKYCIGICYWFGAGFLRNRIKAKKLILDAGLPPTFINLTLRYQDNFNEFVECRKLLWV